MKLFTLFILCVSFLTVSCQEEKNTNLRDSEMSLIKAYASAYMQCEENEVVVFDAVDDESPTVYSVYKYKAVCPDSSDKYKCSIIRLGHSRQGICTLIK